jgi:DNA (cytosine-5)-methyltransferase 1
VNPSRAVAIEIEDRDMAWIRGELSHREAFESATGLTDAELVEIDEVEFFGRTYEQRGSLYIPQASDPLERLRLERQTQIAPKGLDLFCGAGGFSLGMHCGGIDVVAAAEWDVNAAMTYLCNLGLPDCRIGFDSEGTRAKWAKALKKEKLQGDWIGSAYRTSAEMPGGCRGFYLGDITKTTGREILALAGVDHVDVIFGGPPCQGLSNSSSKACIEDPRNALLWEFVRIVEELQPETFVIENVPPLLTIAKGALIEALAARAVNAGYSVTAQVLDAVGYGVAQYRRRAIVVGSRGKKVINYPMPTHWHMGWTPEGKRWYQGEDDDESPRARATFDPATRTWAAPADVGNETGRRAKRQPVSDLFGDSE